MERRRRFAHGVLRRPRDVPHHDFDTAWEIYGKYHGYVASLPRGKVRVVRHDVAEEAGA
ncbi:Uncharacterised protein [Mycobacteroides abscessus subsp. abscessus]|nr:Uncharacterised protein [Mycobacteroides abscessus subsp. abscessus]